MSQERLTRLVAIAVLGLLGLALVYYVAYWLYQGMDERWQALEKAEQKRTSLRIEHERLLAARKQVDQWRAVSLPPDPTQANLRYSTMLLDLLYTHNLIPLQTPDAATAQAGRANKVFRVLNYQWKAEGTLPQMLNFLEDFHRLNLPHAMRDINVSKLSNGKLEIIFKIEALSFLSPLNRDFLPAVPDRNVIRLEILSALKGVPGGITFALAQLGPTGLYGNVAHRSPKPPPPRPGQPLRAVESQGLLAHSKLAGDVTGNRDYRKLPMKNIIVGLVPPPLSPTVSAPKPDLDILDHVQFTAVSSNDIRTVAELRDKLQNRYYKVRSESPLNDLVIRDAANNVLLRARVVALVGRVMVLEWEEKYYAVGMGDNLGPILRGKSLSEAELKAYNVSVANGKEP